MVEETKVKDFKEKKPAKENIPTLKKGVYLFVSYDLVNSTKLKTLCLPHEWQELVDNFYKKTEDLASNPLYATIWKYIGDEVIVYKYIPDPGTLCETIDNAFIALRELNIFIRNWESQSTIHRNLLAVKCATWCALIDNESQEANRCILLRVSTINSRAKQSEQYVPDFIGPDIDIGFRIAKYGGRNRMVLSSDLALLVHKCSQAPNERQQRAYCEQVVKKMRIISFRQLKGVWHDRLYPIVWYEEKSWDEISFEYDEHYSSEIIKELVDSDRKSLKEISTLETIYSDVGMPKKVDVMTDKLQKKSQPRIVGKSGHIK